MWNLLSKGGPVMIPILVGSVVGFAVFLVRLWSLRRVQVAPVSVFERVRTLVASDRAAKAASECAARATSLDRVLAAGLRQAGRPRSEIKERMVEVGRREHAWLLRYVGLVGVIATIEPLLGLLGTVTGMIGVFQGVVGGGVGDPAALASGIWSALITTAAGLSTAIPAYLAYRYLLSRVDKRMGELETQSTLILDLIAAPSEPRQPGGSST